VRQVRRLINSEGYNRVAGRVAKRIVERLDPPGAASLPVTREDLQRAAEIARTGLTPEPLAVKPGEPMTIAWATVPPGAGSGGHTTMFRLVSALERAGHRCVIYLYDRHGWALEQHERTIRAWWPHVRAEVRDGNLGIEDAHAIFATSWESAYPVHASRAKGKRFYLVQDFEPWFYPAGSTALLAESTYRLGFHAVTAGSWLAGLLERDYGMAADHFDFGTDPTYRLDPAAGERTGVCLFARFSTPRRSSELALLALDLFASRHPQVDLHIFGDRVEGLPFRATQHGLQTPQQLSALYNRCIAGLTLSATNVSLVPHEMLAAGCIPVVNDAEHNRIVLDNDHVAYTPATPFDLANALSELVEQSVAARTERARAASASVGAVSWAAAEAAIVDIVERNVTAAAAAIC
jgi:glycosyltransferase involved in cell wall biosynthesis